MSFGMWLQRRNSDENKSSLKNFRDENHIFSEETSSRGFDIPSSDTKLSRAVVVDYVTSLLMRREQGSPSSDFPFLNN